MSARARHGAGAPTRAALAIKSQIVGLVDKGAEKPYHLDVPFPTVNPAEVAPDAAAFAGIVVNETWAQLEPGETSSRSVR